MKSNMQITNRLMIAVVAALMTGGAHAQTTTLIDPGTSAGDDIKNGGFESGSTGNYPNYTVVTDWFNSGGGAGIVAAGNDRERTGAYGGSVALTNTGYSSPAVATGHTIAAGDTFSLTFYYGSAEDWDVGTDTIDVVLYSTSGVIWSDTVTPSQDALAGAFDAFTANNIPAANIGETLFLRFETNASQNRYAAVDDITLEVTAGGPLNPVLIGPGTGAGDDIKNGGFESGSTGNYPNYTVVADWFNSGGGTSVVAAGNDRERTGAYGGSVALTGDGVSSPAVNTGHTIAAGDTFSLTFYYGYCENWDVGTDKINVVLYSTSGVIWSDTVTPSQNALTGNFDLFTANNIPAANIGETLHLRFTPAVVVPGLKFAAIDDVTLTVSPIPTGGFDAWASANGATGQTSQQDHDNDGVENGVEYFMGQTGSSFTAMPGLDEFNTITWPASATYEGTYEVQTSPDLVTWTNVDPRPTPSGGTLSYTLPTGAPGGKSFVRLLVTPTP